MSRHKCKDLNKFYPEKIEPNKYFARTDGKIYSAHKRGPLKPTLRNQYMAVHCCGHTLSVHKVLANFIYNPDPITHTIVNHEDGNKFNNDLKNLEHVTPSENAKHGKRISKKWVAEPLHDMQKKIILKAIQSDNPASYPDLVSLLNL